MRVFIFDVEWSLFSRLDFREPTTPAQTYDLRLRRNVKKIIRYVGFAVLLGTKVIALDNSPIKTEAFHRPIRLACVGDSITAGVGADKGMDYPAQLAAMLGAGWEVRNFGISGATMLRKGNSPYAGALPRVLEYAPNVVVIMLGTNDTKSVNWVHKPEYVADYRWMIGEFQKLAAPPRIFVCYPPLVASPRKNGINEIGVLEAIAMIDRLAEEMPVGVIDMHSALAADSKAYLPDTVHPSTAGATRLAETVYQALAGKEFAAPVASVPTAPVDKTAGDSDNLKK